MWCPDQTQWIRPALRRELLWALYLPVGALFQDAAKVAFGIPRIGGRDFHNPTHFVCLTLSWGAYSEWLIEFILWFARMPATAVICSILLFSYKLKDCTGSSRAKIEKTLMRSTFQDEPSCVRMAQINYIYGCSGCEGLFSFGCFSLTSFDVDRLYRRFFFLHIPYCLGMASKHVYSGLHMASKHLIKTVPFIFWT